MLNNSSKEVYKLSLFRMIMVWLVFLLAFVFLTTRLLYIQIIHPERLIKEGNSRIVRSYSFEPARGLITDRRGKILAISVPVKSIYADAKILNEKKVILDEQLLRTIADILQIDVKELFDKIKDPSRRHVKLKQYLSLERANELKALNVNGLIFNDNYQRFYPTGEVNAQLVGILNAEGNGVYGIEQSFNGYLSAISSKSLAKKDLNGHIIENIGVIQEGKAGGNLMLSVDDRLQAFAYNALKTTIEKSEADSGNVVLIDVKTGEVLAMVNAPSFDPNDRSVFKSQNAVNRAVADIFEPGSTVKPIVALSALDAGLVSWNEVFDTRPYVIDGKLVKDSHYMNQGSLRDILKYSSNTGMAHIAQRVGHTTILNMLYRFGFGQKTNLGLTAESRGTLNANRKFWAEIDKATLGYGYGIAITSLQLASAYATLANYGSRVNTSILRTHKQEIGVQVANINEVRRMHQALETVVSEGTGGKAAINRYRIAGKTGTARIAGVGGYEDKYIATFAGFAPISNPRFALVVVINNPKKGSYYGGSVSGPIFQAVMTHALQLYNVEPDKE